MNKLSDHKDHEKKLFPSANEHCQIHCCSKYQIEVTKSSRDVKKQVVTEKDIFCLIEPYLKKINNKFLCTICEVKFSSQNQACTHVENKHIDCLLYKCPLCRVTKVTRLGYESHLRRGHWARVKDYCPKIKLRKSFMVKSEKKTCNLDY